MKMLTGKVVRTQKKHSKKKLATLMALVSMTLITIVMAYPYLTAYFTATQTIKSSYELYEIQDITLSDAWDWTPTTETIGEFPHQPLTIIAHNPNIDVELHIYTNESQALIFAETYDYFKLTIIQKATGSSIYPESNTADLCLGEKAIIPLIYDDWGTIGITPGTNYLWYRIDYCAKGLVAVTSITVTNTITVECVDIIVP